MNVSDIKATMDRQITQVESYLRQKESSAEGNLHFDLGAIVGFVAASIVIPIWVNILSSILFEKIKGKILSEQEAKEQKELIALMIKELNDTARDKPFVIHREIWIQHVQVVLSDAGINSPELAEQITDQILIGEMNDILGKQG